MKAYVTRSVFGISLFLSMTFLHSCAPVFSEIQSARTVGEDNLEITPSFTSTTVNEDGNSNGVQDNIGFRLAYGLSPTVDLRAKYERIWINNCDNCGTSIAGIGPKYSLKQDKIAFYLPLGRAFGQETNETWQLHPTFLFTQTIKDQIDFTFAPKYLITFCEDCDDLLALNFGFALSNDFKKWAFRGEYGILHNLKQDTPGHYGQLSLGLSYVFQGKKEVASPNR